MAPKRTPGTILDKIHGALTRTVNDPATKKLMEAQGGEPLTGTGAEFLKLINDEYQRFGQAIKLAGLKVE
jgi:tripartite-type tricarboxylate transporter receptor subunit TctC